MWTKRRKIYRNNITGRDRDYRASDSLTIDDEGRATQRSIRAAKRTCQKAKVNIKKRPNPRELSAAYDRYVHYVQDQDKIAAEDVDLKSFIECFKHCPLIKNATVNIGGSRFRRSRKAKAAFLDAHTTPSGDFGRASGVRQLTVLLCAAQECGVRLSNLAAGEISHDFFNQPESTVDKIKAAVEQLKSLYFSMYHPMIDIVGYPPPEHTDPEGMKNILETLRRHGMRDFVGSAIQARIIRIDCPRPDKPEDSVPMNLVMGDQYTFKELRWLSLVGMKTSKAELVSLLHRHRHTLKHVYFAYMHLTQGTWQDTFETLAGTLPRVHTFEFRGNLTAEEEPGSLNWMGFGHRISVPPTLKSYAVDLYLRKGDGPFPATEEEIHRRIHYAARSDEVYSTTDMSLDDEIDFLVADRRQAEMDVREEERGYWEWL